MKRIARSAIAAGAAALALAACSDPAAPPVTTVELPSASRAGTAPGVGSPIPDEYIVVFRSDVADARGLARQLAAAHGASVRFSYTSAIRGFAGHMSAQAAAALARNPNVAYVEQDQVVTADGVQTGATWGLDRIDQTALPLDGSYSYATTARTVTAYIIDTGIRFSHGEFGGRAKTGYDAVDGGAADDCNGHGTHVAGTVGGATYGVAKDVNLIAVRVLDCSGSGSWSGVIAGMDWVAQNRVLPAVANMSLGGGASTAVDQALQRMIGNGVATAVAAGNGNQAGRQQDACASSPARVPEAMTIGATDRTDTKASWSNYGNCVDWFAPGVGITSAWSTSNSATNTISGTSMATPHVTGAAALWLATHATDSPAQVASALAAASTKGIVRNSSTAHNDLLYVGSDGTTTPGNTPPSASFSAQCTDLSCSFTNGSSDVDGDALTYSWHFGDNTSTSSATNPSHTYSTTATTSYQVTLTVNDGKTTSTASQTVTVSPASEPPPSAGITLSATGTRTRGTITDVVLTWSGATTAEVVIFRDGAKVNTVPNSGTFSEQPNTKGSVNYQVCESGGAGRCSAVVSASF